MAKKIIVTGGCGYIGSHTVVDLVQNGYDVVIIDNLSRSSLNILNGVEKILNKKVVFHPIDLTDKTATFDTLSQHQDASGIIHFAAYKSVFESTEQPLKYYQNNMVGLFNILEAAEKYKIQNFVFSSSCSVYGLVENLPVTEDTPFQEAQCAYARTKQHGEQVLTDVAKATHLKTILLRYFNPVGAHPSSEIGEMPIDIPNNLAPFITQTAIGKREKLIVYGDDYPTRDGSCIRDYIHVCDIAHAHTLAIDYLLKKPPFSIPEVFNLGTGNGVTVLEAIKAFEKSTGISLKYEIGARRAGDVIEVYADNTKAISSLGWQLNYTIDDMMLSAWNWEKKMAETL
ncbi:MAG: UDP-glucose 4-epimerase GalE [Chitinophagales bacterium]|nr:UDP-glucose 4-epimerase GalE [Chitinophagales bacterium]MCZ2393878.1 UDP-glucose 4-epimerase GalE [Chitinophagales bacterium]